MEQYNQYSGRSHYSRIHFLPYLVLYSSYLPLRLLVWLPDDFSLHSTGTECSLPKGMQWLFHRTWTFQDHCQSYLKKSELLCYDAKDQTKPPNTILWKDLQLIMRWKVLVSTFRCQQYQLFSLTKQKHKFSMPYSHLFFCKFWYTKSNEFLFHLHHLIHYLKETSFSIKRNKRFTGIFLLFCHFLQISCFCESEVYSSKERKLIFLWK